MDTNSALLSTTTATTIFGVAVLIYRAVNHKRVRSNCCGKKMEMSVDVENTTPPETPPSFVVNNPQKQIQVLVKNGDKE
jgi:hypothetical protein